MTELEFFKLHGSGNDFILIDNRDGKVPKKPGRLAAELCQRRLSIGADGLILLEKSNSAHFRMRYYNSDGSEAAMCGNGGRCIAFFALLRKAAPFRMTLETSAGRIEALVKNYSERPTTPSKATVKLGLGEPRQITLDFTLRVERKDFLVSFINTGVPHAVLFVQNLEQISLEELGKMIRYHRHFSPQGTNVNLAKLADNNTIRIRTYERGVEGETLSCGTGATAVAVIAGLKGLVHSPVKILTRGGETLRVYFRINPEADLLSPVTNVCLEGPVKLAFRGWVTV